MNDLLTKKCKPCEGNVAPYNAAQTKEMLAKLHGMNFLDALDFAANMNAAARMTPDCRQGIEAFLSKKTMTW